VDRNGSRRLGALVGLTVMLGCGPSRDVWPADVVDNFMRACSARAAERTCRCALDALQRRFTLEEFRALEQRAAAGEAPKEMMDAVAECR